MSKAKKIVIIILSCVIGTFAIATLVSWIIIPNETIAFIMYVWDLLNRPLPVIGISILMLGFLLWRIFARSSYGEKKLNELKKQHQALEQDYNEYKEKTAEREQRYINTINALKDSAQKHDEFLKGVVKAIPNKRVQRLGVKFYGEERKEETDNQAGTN